MPHDINKLIDDYRHRLMLAKDPKEIEIAKNELKRLERLKKEYEAEVPATARQYDTPVASTGNHLPLPQPDRIPVVLIVHGHDEEMKKNVQLFINRCGLTDLVWMEEPDNNCTIIEKLTDDRYIIDYVIALMSPDDLLSNGALRARQNVIFEIGYYLCKLGRSRVRMLLKGDPEIPSDLQGILYTRYDTNGAWKMQLAKEMKAVGITVNLEKVVNKF